MACTCSTLLLFWRSKHFICLYYSPNLYTLMIKQKTSTVKTTLLLERKKEKEEWCSKGRWRRYKRVSDSKVERGQKYKKEKLEKEKVQRKEDVR